MNTNSSYLQKPIIGTGRAGSPRPGLSIKTWGTNDLYFDSTASTPMIGWDSDILVIC